jgi:IS5 family transposase
VLAQMKQQTLAMAADQDNGFEHSRKPTRREEFLRTMETIVPWAALCQVIEPHYPKAGNGRPPIGLGAHAAHPFLQHWFNLADLACEEALYDSASLRRFVGIDLGRERVPDATTLLKFRKLLNEQKLGEALFAKVGQQLQERGFKVNTGTIVDATIIAAPSSTKNADKARDPDMHQTRKGQQWYFGMKLHIGVDSQSGLAHSAVVTAANVHDKHPLPDLLHGNEQRVYGDSAYASQKALIASKAPKAKDFTNQRTRRAGEVDEVQRAKNRNKSRVRARVEHVFAVVKRLWGFTKVRYRGLQKNATRAFTALALANIYLAESCEAQATAKKLAGAAKTSFMKKCEGDAKGSDAAAACEAQAKEKKLAGAASTSFVKKCEADAKATSAATACETQATEKKLAGAAKTSFLKKCAADAK